MGSSIMRINRHYLLATNAPVSAELDLHLALDEIAEIVAIEQCLSALGATPAPEWCEGWVSLDPDDLLAADAQISDDCLLYSQIGVYELTTGGGQVVDHLFAVMPAGIFTATNPWISAVSHSANLAVKNTVAIHYRVLRPSINELAAVVARRR